MKAVLVIEMPNEYADRYNVNEMYVWGLTVQDKHGYAMLDLVTDKPNHLRPLPNKLNNFEPILVPKDMSGILNNMYCEYENGWNDCLAKITGETE